MKQVSLSPIRAPQALAAQTLSDWFDAIAADLEAQVDTRVKQMKTGTWTETRFCYRLSLLSPGGPDSLDIAGLDGFRRVEQAAQHLNIEGELHLAAPPANDTSGHCAISFTFDALEPYKPVTVARGKK